MPKIDIGKLRLDTRRGYPPPHDERVAGRSKKRLGDAAGLTQFGVNLTTLKSGSASALRHWHENEDEFIYVLEGEPTLFTDAGETRLSPGMVAGFAASATAHHLENRSDRDCVFLEIGDRSAGDEVSYPADDIQAALGANGTWRFVHKDGKPY